jgi:hypothetical protein
MVSIIAALIFSGAMKKNIKLLRYFRVRRKSLSDPEMDPGRHGDSIALKSLPDAGAYDSDEEAYP